MRNPFSRSVQMRGGFPVLPGGFPLVGHLPMLYRGLPEAVEAARGLGKMCWFTFGLGNWVLLCQGAEALEILGSKAFTSTHLKEIAPVISGESLLSQDGPLHKHMRSAMNGPFMPRGLSAGAFGRMSAGVLGGLAARWAERKQATVLPDVQTVTLEILFRMLGVSIADIEPWRKHYRDLILANLNVKLRFPGSPAVRSERAKVWIDEQLRGIIAEARRSPTEGGLIGALVQAKDDEGQPLTDEELTDNLRLLILGGHETISSTLAWIVLSLAHHPELWDTLVSEANKADRVPESPEEARALPFAEAVFRETVRMHPAFLAITRKSVTPFELHGKTIPEGTLVAVDLWGISHDEGLFPEPFAFRPARWLGRKAAPSPVEISQFGKGPHFCLGYHLAWLEAVQFAVALARTIGSRGLRPVLRDQAHMTPIYIPQEHPSPRAVVDFR
jgi:cytochrome P450